MGLTNTNVIEKAKSRDIKFKFGFLKMFNFQGHSDFRMPDERFNAEFIFTTASNILLTFLCVIQIKVLKLTIT